MSQWKWTPERNLGIWRHGAVWMRPFVAAMPYLTVLTLLLMMYFIGGTLTSSRGVLFDLPDGGVALGEDADLVALVMPISHDMTVFFDDSRYLMGDGSSMRSFGENLAECVGRSERKSLLVLADRRVSMSCLMELVTLAKRSGVEKVLLSGKATEGVD